MRQSLEKYVKIEDDLIQSGIATEVKIPKLVKELITKPDAILLIVKLIGQFIKFDQSQVEKELASLTLKRLSEVLNNWNDDNLKEYIVIEGELCDI